MSDTEVNVPVTDSIDARTEIQSGFYSWENNSRDPLNYFFLLFSLSGQKHLRKRRPLYLHD